jgi:hypothetical protein
MWYGTDCTVRIVLYVVLGTEHREMFRCQEEMEGYANTCDTYLLAALVPG